MKFRQLIPMDTQMTQRKSECSGKMGQYKPIKNSGIRTKDRVIEMFFATGIPNTKGIDFTNMSSSPAMS